MNHEPEGQHPATGPAASNLTAADSEPQNLLLDRPDVVGFLRQFAALSAALVPRTSCGVTMRRDHQAATVASSDEFAMLLGEIRYGRGQGPCLQAPRTGERVKVAAGRPGYRWRAGTKPRKGRTLAGSSASRARMTLCTGGIAW